jgi:hypothetical protein
MSRPASDALRPSSFAATTRAPARSSRRGRRRAGFTLVRGSGPPASVIVTTGFAERMLVGNERSPRSRVRRRRRGSARWVRQLVVGTRPANVARPSMPRSRASKLEPLTVGPSPRLRYARRARARPPRSTSRSAYGQAVDRQRNPGRRRAEPRRCGRRREHPSASRPVESRSRARHRRRGEDLLTLAEIGCRARAPCVARTLSADSAAGNRCD